MTRDGGRRLASDTSLVLSSVHMAVRDQLRADILTGQFLAGSRLQQWELARRYGVSITPIREALRDLASEGLVDFGPFSGAIVHSPTLVELRDIYDLRAHLYPLAVRSAVANMTDELLNDAQALAEAMADPSTAPEAWVVQNRQLHRILDQATENTHLAAVLARLADISALYVYVSDKQAGRRPEADAEHLALITAYRQRDEATATQLILGHITHTLEHATSVLARDTTDLGEE
jgi:DNA-binding GntR family transcriptional regulator